ncbi:hypothetical protein T4A_3489, partial [Trichinella pseudospiralis]
RYWTRSTTTCRQSCLNSEVAALKDRKLSDWIISGLPCRRSASITLADVICGTSSRCTARDPIQPGCEQAHTALGSSFAPDANEQWPRKIHPVCAKAAASLDGKAAILGRFGLTIAHRQAK